MHLVWERNEFELILTWILNQKATFFLNAYFPLFRIHSYYCILYNRVNQLEVRLGCYALSATDRFCKCVADSMRLIQPHVVKAPPCSDNLVFTSEQTTPQGRRPVVEGTRPISRLIDLTAHSRQTATVWCPTQPPVRLCNLLVTAPISYITQYDWCTGYHKPDYVSEPSQGALQRQASRQWGCAADVREHRKTYS